MRRDEPCPAAVTGEAGAAIRGELLDERAAPAARIPVIAKAGAARRDRFFQNADDGVAEKRRFGQRYARAGA
jgi:hypothetical protein